MGRQVPLNTAERRLTARTVITGCCCGRRREGLGSGHGEKALGGGRGQEKPVTTLGEEAFAIPADMEAFTAVTGKARCGKDLLQRLAGRPQSWP